MALSPISREPPKTTGMSRVDVELDRVFLVAVRPTHGWREAREWLKAMAEHNCEAQRADFSACC
jgi:hypothetical protein